MDWTIEVRFSAGPGILSSLPRLDQLWDPPILKRPEREADHSSTSSTEVKNAWSYTSIPPIYIHGVVK